MAYSNPTTIKLSNQDLNEITKTAQRLGIGRSTLLREVVTRYLPHYLSSMDMQTAKSGMQNATPFTVIVKEKTL